MRLKHVAHVNSTTKINKMCLIGVILVPNALNSYNNCNIVPFTGRLILQFTGRLILQFFTEFDIYFEIRFTALFAPLVTVLLSIFRKSFPSSGILVYKNLKGKGALQGGNFVKNYPVDGAVKLV
jgi:hypothetical protein